MSTVRFKFIIKDLNVRLWSAWTRRYLLNNVVKRCIRDWSAKEVIQCFKHTILRPRRTLLLSATAAYKSSDDHFTCDQGITDDELQALLSELNITQNLARMTLYCTSCGKRLVIDRKQNGVSYCGCKEPKTSSDPEGWVPFMEAEDVIIWRKEYKPGQGLYAYKVYGRYPEISASDFAAVQIDGAYRRSWDSAVASLSVVQRNVGDVPGQTVLHWEVIWPRLFANRDYVYIRRHKEFEIKSEKPKTERKPTFERSVHARAKQKSLESDMKPERSNDKLYIIVSKSCEHPDVPETRHAIRVSEYWSHMVVRSIDGSDKVGVQFVLTYYDEAGGGMAGGVAAWASGRAAPAYLRRLRAAARDYACYEHKQELPDFTPFGPEVIKEKETVKLLEQDMESSKQGPEMNGTTRDQSSQTDDYILSNISNKITKEEDKVSEDATKINNGVDVDLKVEEKVVEEKVVEDKSEEKEVEVEKKGEEEEEEENNGSWWRYLNNEIHDYLNIATVTSEIERYKEAHLLRLTHHPNPLAYGLLDNANVVKRLKRNHVF